MPPNGKLAKPTTLGLVAAVLILRSKLLTYPKDVIVRLGTIALKERVTPEALAEALQQLYVEDDGGNKTLLVPTKTRIAKVGIHNVASLQLPRSRVSRLEAHTNDYYVYHLLHVSTNELCSGFHDKS